MMPKPRRRNEAKLEAFAAELAKGKSAPEAARIVGYGGTSLVSNAKRRACNPFVRARVAELRKELAARTLVTMESLTAEAEEARLLAMRLEQPSAANACIATKARLHGLLRDRVDATTEIRGVRWLEPEPYPNEERPSLPTERAGNSGNSTNGRNGGPQSLPIVAPAKRYPDDSPGSPLPEIVQLYRRVAP